MFYIFTLICHQQAANVLARFFSHGGFGLVDVLDSFVTIRCSMYCDITVFILS
jgi:hypothetical protein